MGPKRLDSISRTLRLSQSTVAGAPPSHIEPEVQQCVGKFAADLDFCCRQPSHAYPVHIPVFIRGHSRTIIPPTAPSNPPLVLPTVGSIAPSVINAPVIAPSEGQISPQARRPSRGRLSSTGQSFIQNGTLPIDIDTKSVSTAVLDMSRGSVMSYKTFHVIRDSEFFRPKLLVDSVGSETEPIEQINALYMKGWLLDQRFIDILKKVLPLQEHLHTLNFSHVGLNENTTLGLVELCPLIKNLRALSLDGNPLAAKSFYQFIEKEDSKIIHLSLRFCNITDAEIDRIAHVLGNPFTQNWKLLTLSLTGNRIGDNGARAIAKALRYNRTLLSLNLSSNFLTDRGACALASVLRQMILTDEEVVRWRYLIAANRVEPQIDENKRRTSSPAGSVTSARDAPHQETKRTGESSKRKGNLAKEKNQRKESKEENRSTSMSKGDTKKSKSERAPSANPRRASTAATAAAAAAAADSARGASTAREKKAAMGAVLNPPKKTSHDEKHDKTEKSIIVPLKVPDRTNPLLTAFSSTEKKGEVYLRGNFILLSLNLSRNYLTLKAVEEFLLSVQHQIMEIQLHSTPTTNSLLEFSGLSRLELKGMNDIPMKSSTYESLETLLHGKNPTFRFQQHRERENKTSSEQQIETTAPTSTPLLTERSRRASHSRGTAKHKDPIGS